MCLSKFFVLKKILLYLLLVPTFVFAQIPAYYSSIDFSQTGEALQSQLSNLITTTHTTELVYTSGSSGFLDTWTVLRESDLLPEAGQNVALIYGWDNASSTVSEDRFRDVSLSCHTSSCSGKWVREHVFPRSIGTPNLGSEFAGADAHNLRAIDAQRNNTRSNRLFADAPSSAASFSVGNNSWYPGDEWRGDVARIIMYMYLRYPTQCNPNNVATGGSSQSPLGNMPDVLLLWNAQDPPSEFEINRNNVIASHQGNRNPFIDNPYLATAIWSGTTAVDTWNVLSISEKNIPQFSVYPTVTKSLIYVEDSTSVVQFRLYSISGQLVNEGKADNAIDISNQATGLYLLQISNSTTSQVFKIIKE